jgi:hypothetical protein
VHAGEAYLKPDSFDTCVRVVFGAKANAVLQALTRTLANLRSGPEKLKRLDGVLRGLNEAKLELLPGVPVVIAPFLSERSAAKTTVRFPTIASAPKAVFVFHPNNECTHTWSDGGLEQFGPYDAEVFTPTQPRVCVVCQRDKKGQVETFLKKFSDGVGGSGDRRAPFAQGFVRKYRLQELRVEFFLADNPTPVAYAKAVRQALAVQDQDGQGQRWHLAMVQIEELFHNLSEDANPYLLSKAEFMAHDIPVQEFEIETASLRDSQLQYALNNMALAVYAKLGGVPWRVRSNRALAHELVFGLGSAIISDSILGSKERVVGVTTVFSGDGYYWLSNLSRSVPFEEYQETLLASLRDTVAQVKADMNWQKGDTIRLVFHSFKPFKDAEAEAVKQTMEELGDFNVEFAFLHVVEDHPYLLFDKEQRGVRAGGQSLKGVYAPPRGLFTQLSPSELLITLTGPSDLKKPEDGLPFPVLLRLHRESSFNDMVYLARQLFVFASHSWRSFFPSSMPVTILYSQLIAGMLGKLARVPRWNPNSMLGRIGRTRWFL